MSTRLSMRMIGESDTSDTESGSNGKGEHGALLEERGNGGSKNIKVLPRGKGRKARVIKKGPRKLRAGKHRNRIGNSRIADIVVHWGKLEGASSPSPA